MLPPLARTLLVWSAGGVAAGTAAALAVAATLAASGRDPGTAIAAGRSLIVLPVPLGWFAGVTAGYVAAAERGAPLLVAVAVASAVLGATVPPLAPPPIVLGAAGARLARRRWQRRLAAGSAGVAAGIGLVAVPLSAVLGPGRAPLLAGLAGALITGVLLARALLTP